MSRPSSRKVSTKISGDIEVPALTYYENPLRGPKDAASQNSKTQLYFTIFVGLVACVGGVLAGYYTGIHNRGDDNGTASAAQIKPNIATVDEMVQSGVGDEAVQMLVAAREDIGVVADVMDLYDFLEDSNYTVLTDGLAEVDYDPLAGVNPADEAFLRVARQYTVESEIGGCASDQLCVNTASADELRKLKFIGRLSARDFVTRRDGHCFSSISQLTDSEVMSAIGIRPTTKGAFTKMMRYGNQAKNLCAACGCSLCSSGEEWVNGACASKCPPSGLWDASSSACVDAGTRRRRLEEEAPAPATAKPCTGTQICLNTATAAQIDKFKWVGIGAARDFVAKRNGHCFIDVNELKDTAIMTSLGLKSTTKSAFKKSLNANQATKMCSECGCATCSSAEEWTGTECAPVPTAAPTTAAPTGTPTSLSPTSSPTTGRPSH